tara:strand:- start:516 stop:914 length:399 start_codon:yes stop_codon:yes gene_type:complete
MVKKPNERIMVYSRKERDDRTRQVLAQDVKPMNAIERERWLKSERNFYYNAFSQGRSYASRLTIPMTNITELKKASRELSALAKKLAEISTQSTSVDDRIILAQFHIGLTGKDLKQSAVGFDPKTGSYRGIK